MRTYSFNDYISSWFIAISIYNCVRSVYCLDLIILNVFCYYILFYMFESKVHIFFISFYFISRPMRQICTVSMCWHKGSLIRCISLGPDLCFLLISTKYIYIIHFAFIIARLDNVYKWHFIFMVICIISNHTIGNYLIFQSLKFLLNFYKYSFHSNLTFF